MADDEMMGQQFDAEHDKNAIADRNRIPFLRLMAL